MNRSDDFSDVVKKALGARVGQLCSNPECRALTSGPQQDPARAVNLGVAAHITAASFGGPRYDPDLLPEERSDSSNGLWLCQNCAKLIDNDPSRFSVEVLKKWKTDAETEAKRRLGKTASFPTNLFPELKIRDKVRITPVIPRDHEQSQFSVLEDTGSHYVFQKLDSMRNVDIPKSFLENIHHLGSSKPSLLQLKGRLQWVSSKRNFELFPDKPSAGPAGEYGIGKEVDIGYPARQRISGRFGREDRLPEILGRGWLVFYDLDGKYLKWRGQDVDQILVVDWV
jgi:hypothetical protein